MEIINTSQKKQFKQDVTVFSSFILHFSVFVGINITLWVTWLASGGTVRLDAWPLYVSTGWGIVLLVHFFKANRQFRKRAKN